MELADLQVFTDRGRGGWHRGRGAEAAPGAVECDNAGAASRGALGVQLFVRERQRLHLSAAGERLLEYADRTAAAGRRGAQCGGRTAGWSVAVGRPGEHHGQPPAGGAGAVSPRLPGCAGRAHHRYQRRPDRCCGRAPARCRLRRRSPCFVRVRPPAALRRDPGRHHRAHPSAGDVGTRRARRLGHRLPSRVRLPPGPRALARPWQPPAPTRTGTRLVPRDRGLCRLGHRGSRDARVGPRRA